MDNFIDLTDYDSSIHKEILGALVRKETQPGVANPSYDPEIIETCEDRAVGEMQGYLNKAYDVAAIFSARGFQFTHPGKGATVWCKGAYYRADKQA